MEIDYGNPQCNSCSALRKTIYDYQMKLREKEERILELQRLVEAYQNIGAVPKSSRQILNG